MAESLVSSRFRPQRGISLNFFCFHTTPPSALDYCQRFGLAANCDKPTPDHQHHAEDDEQRRHSILHGPVDQRGEDDNRVNERTKLDRRCVAVRAHDEHLGEKLRKSDVEQLNPGPRLEWLPIDRGDRRNHHRGKQKIIEENPRHRLGRSVAAAQDDFSSVAGATRNTLQPITDSRMVSNGFKMLKKQNPAYSIVGTPRAAAI
jgi:hypothetical protein